MSEIQALLEQEAEDSQSASNVLDEPQKSPDRRPVSYEEAQYEEEQRGSALSKYILGSGVPTATVAGAGSVVWGLYDPMTAIMAAGVAGSTMSGLRYQSDESESDGKEYYLLEDDQIDVYDGVTEEDAIEHLVKESEIQGVADYRQNGRSRLGQIVGSVKDRIHGSEPPEHVVGEPPHADREQCLDTYDSLLKDEATRTIIHVDTDDPGDFDLFFWTTWDDAEIDVYRPFTAVAGYQGDRSAYPDFAEYDDEQRVSTQLDDL